RYPAPTSGVGPIVPGRSTTWMTARPASAIAATARTITSAPCAGCDGPRRANIGVPPVVTAIPGPEARTEAVVVFSTTNTLRRYGGFNGTWCELHHSGPMRDGVRSADAGPAGGQRMRGRPSVSGCGAGRGKRAPLSDGN